MRDRKRYWFICYLTKNGVPHEKVVQATQEISKIKKEELKEFADFIIKQYVEDKII